MDKKRLFKILAHLIFFIFIAHMLATKFYWYYSTWYFDMIMHFLGGFWLGLCALYFFTFTQISLRSIFITITFVFFVGFGWEIFEFIFYHYLAQTSFDLLDTLSDLFFDILGGASSLVYFFKRIMLQSKDSPWGNSLKDCP